MVTVAAVLFTVTVDTTSGAAFAELQLWIGSSRVENDVWYQAMSAVRVSIATTDGNDAPAALHEGSDPGAATP